MNNFETEIIKYIAFKRRELGISQEYFSQIVALDQTIISKIEQGRRRLSLEEAMVFLTALGLSVEEIVEAIKLIWNKCNE